ncbi:hypothetical protein [Paenibacillus segetis]|uniref:Uncharacterized protein n=1 Tax=Paenibacillus segetis TaxID=1325360 RepID=A0ABQ1YC64_9BACL|nr:hypothetical protein [Paenibacillus segetis]GGH20651.1 hypothetical protein GCM10008013_18150 [Paenibacillus segetis]
MAKKLNIILSFLLVIIISFCCGVYFSEDLGYNRSASTTVKAEQTLAGDGDDAEQMKGTVNKASNENDEEDEAISADDIQSGDDPPSDEPEVTQVNAENRISEPSEFKFGVNSVNGITLSWWVTNLTDKTINYYTVKLSTFNPVGDPSYDEHSGDSSFNIRYVGPINPGEEFGVFSRFTYQATLDSIRIDEVELEYADGTVESIIYNRTTTDDSGLNSK